MRERQRIEGLHGHGEWGFPEEESEGTASGPGHYRLKLWVKAQEEGFTTVEGAAIAVGAVSQHGFIYKRFLMHSSGVDVFLAEGPLENAAAWLSEEPRTAPFPAGSLLFYQFA